VIAYKTFVAAKKAAVATFSVLLLQKSVCYCILAGHVSEGVF
jgi:hypothetical protein